MTDLIDRALSYAVEAHQGQKRKGKQTPYAVHPIAVGRLLSNYGCSDDVVAAGFLHDVVEDTDYELEDIETEFGSYVAELVNGASEHDKSASWEERKEHTISHLEEAPYDVLLVKTADKLDNMRSIRQDYEELGDELWTKFTRGKDKQEWYYRSVADVLDLRFDTEPGVSMCRELQEEIDLVFRA